MAQYPLVVKLLSCKTSATEKAKVSTWTQSTYGRQILVAQLSMGQSKTHQLVLRLNQLLTS
jgi:hypothetical protein